MVKAWHYEIALVMAVLAGVYVSMIGVVGDANRYYLLAYWHLATVIPAFLIGTYVMVRRKGSHLHQQLGRIYMLCMLMTAVISLFMPARVGPTLFGHFGFIHLFSVSVFYTVPAAWMAIRAGNIRAHRNGMIGLYVGGLVVAGALALSPGRLLHSWLMALIG